MNNSAAKAGTLLQVDNGAYSDYSVTGFFVVLQDFTPAEQLAQFLAAHPEQAPEYHFSNYKFVAYLIGKGFLLEILYGGLYLGSYKRHEDCEFTPVISHYDWDM